MLASRNVSVQVVLGRERDLRHGDRSLVKALAARSDVSVDRVERQGRTGSRASTRPAPRRPSTRRTRSSPGVNQVHAPGVWALGFTGQGIVIANQDTGMRWTHNAIKPHYRGWNGSTADHNYNWHDSIHSGGGICSAEPHGALRRPLSRDAHDRHDVR